ncbi:Ulp1 family isopeptidase [Legionella sp. km772]|uniref:Ulp1 family isopeptidase n=1 Tax=Legionella sp. km772 TaxID=2498111 RepID=UPI000F8F55F6|nr:Ulp1 family isopeptidase [Legionella sp. km772]RUR10433.1 hypothetical protein ELY15_08155 [Legionella sp. km772]
MSSLDGAIFECLLAKLPLTYAQLDRASQAELDCTRSQLSPEEESALAITLESSEPITYSILPVRPTPRQAPVIDERSPEWERACENALFRAIATKDLRSLERLLGLKNYLPKSAIPPVRVGNRGFFASLSTASHSARNARAMFTTKQGANEMVTHFLQKTPASSLKGLISQSTHAYFERLLHACGKHCQYQFAINHDLNPVILYLPLDELKPMIKALLGLGFYQDHRACLMLVEALFLRKQGAASEVEALTQLQYLLLDKAIAHHSPHHHQVTPKLRQQRAAIEGQNERLLSEELREEFALPTPVAAPISTTSAQPSMMPRTTSQAEIQPSSQSLTRSPSSFFAETYRSAGFREESLVLANGEPNRQAYYSAEQVHSLLANKLGRKNNVHLLAAWSYCKAPSERTFKAHVLNFLGNHEPNNPAHLIVPICINSHWVGVKLCILGDEVSINYYDSVKNSAAKDRVLHLIKEAVHAIYADYQVSLADKTYYFQDDSASCGAYLVENIAKDVLGTIGKKYSTQTLRQKHIEILGLQAAQSPSGKRLREEEMPPQNIRKRLSLQG